MTGDDFIKSGFWAQLTLLFLVDWGSLVAFEKADYVPWYHWVGFILVNVVLLSATWFVWKWLKPQRGHDVEESQDGTVDP